MQNENKLHVEILTPAKSWFNGPADIVHLSTDLGEMEILPGHATLVGTGSVSEVAVKSGDHVEDFLLRLASVSVAEDGRTVKILAQVAEKRAEMDASSLREYIDFVKGMLGAPEKLSEYQVKFLGEQKASVEKTLAIIKE
jgi:F0F1-type ATP synthase epsilon subunit